MLASRLSRVALACFLLCLSLALAAPARATAPQGEALAKLFQRFEAYAEKNRKAFGVPGMAIAVVADDKVIWSKGLGSTALKGGAPVNPRTIFQIGSASKSFTAGLVGIMADQGKLSWDDPVIKHYPGFLMHDAWVTRNFLVKDLMAQHTGLAPHAGETQAFLGFTTQQMIDSLQYMEPITSFRSAFAYQNIPFLVGAAMVNRYTGGDYASDLQKLIFTPLGMKSTSVPKSGLTKGKNVTRLHQRHGGKVVMLAKDWAFSDWTYQFAAAGGICSNVMDMTQWLRLHINRGTVDGKEIIKPETVDFLHTPATPAMAKISEGELYQYCQGWVYVRYAAPYTMIFHNGDTTANHTMMAFMPGRKVGIVMLSNLGGVNLMDRLAHYFFDLYVGQEPGDYAGDELKKVLAAEKEAGLPPRPKNALPPQPLKNYAGVYSNPVYKKTVVKVRGKDLVLLMGPKKVEMQLKPWDRDVFVAMDIIDPTEPFSQVNFMNNGDGVVDSFVMSVLANEAGGLFTRVPEKK
ncbi:MAG: serine hydrolase [Desulfarculaceae bacterium]|nr:serine hydrolase [Desulfarculaceae bacterium]